MMVDVGVKIAQSRHANTKTKVWNFLYPLPWILLGELLGIVGFIILLYTL
jgi:hypothetical protein